MAGALISTPTSNKRLERLWRNHALLHLHTLALRLSSAWNILTLAPLTLWPPTPSHSSVFIPTFLRVECLQWIVLAPESFNSHVGPTESRLNENEWRCTLQQEPHTHIQEYFRTCIECWLWLIGLFRCKTYWKCKCDFLITSITHKVCEDPSYTLQQIRKSI